VLACAAQPPMGWNSYDAYGTTINESQVREHSSSARVIFGDGKLAVWLATPSEGAGDYIAVFNLGESFQSRDMPWPQIGIGGRISSLRDLWRHKDLGRRAQLRIDLAAHASALYRVAVQ
jgi:alpha-galactosidase